MKLSIVIPAFNEEANVTDLCLELRHQIQTVAQIKDYEILWIDDHSSDNTLDAIADVGDSHVRGYRLSRRSGSHIAIRAGLQLATGDAVLAVSADGQEDPAVLQGMIEQWSGGTQVVWGLRKSRRGESALVRLPANSFYRILGMIGAQANEGIDLSRADFYLLDRAVVDAVNACRERKTSLFGLINWLGFKTGSVEYERRSRRSGRSKWNLAGRFNLAWDWITSFSGVPLRFVFWLGAIAVLTGLLCLIGILFGAMTGAWMGKDAMFMGVMLLIGGGQLIGIGILGEYLWRNVEESRGRPLYFIQEKV